jgi:hydrogenase nickel incorporation protein HypA/HybF
MHEMSIAQSIFDIVSKEMEKHEVTKVIAVNLKVGKMSAVVPSSLLFCWSVLTRGGHLEGAKLIIDEVPVRIRCRDCGHDSLKEDYRLVCPQCRSFAVDVVSGRELTVQDIEAE